MKNRNPHIKPKRDELLVIFDITEVQRIQFRTNHLRQLLEDQRNIIDGLTYVRCDTLFKDRYIVDIFLEPARHTFGTLTRQIEFLKKRKKYLKADPDTPMRPVYNDIPLEDLKEQIKIRDILEQAGVTILRNNFFKIRNENTASSQFDEDQNIFCDRGNANKGGSVIDLYATLHGMSIADAIKELKTML